MHSAQEQAGSPVAGCFPAAFGACRASLRELLRASGWAPRRTVMPRWRSRCGCATGIVQAPAAGGSAGGLFSLTGEPVGSVLTPAAYAWLFQAFTSLSSESL